MSFPRYPKYNDSGIEWLGEVPVGWGVKRLKRICHAFPSNVDKKSRDGETSVSLCNYTDVYYNEKIVSGMDFMSATASDDQIEKFTLNAGDTIITKDSESADDIAVAAYVSEDLPGVVCGYHLSMIRPIEGTDGAFVKRLFDSIYVKSCFEVSANGLTRMGLGQYAVNNIELPSPPPTEQTAIASFLDRETAKIDELVAEQQRLIELLKEKRQAVISHAVTKGLNPDAPMKDSGIEWLGEVPEHWEVASLKRFFESLDGRRIPLSSEERSYRQGEIPYYGASGTIDHVDDFIFDEDLVLVSEDGANLLMRSTPIAFVARGKYWVNNHAHILKPPDKNLIFWAERIETIDLTPIVSGAAQPKLTIAALNSLKIAVPPTEAERAEIETHVANEAVRHDTLSSEAQQAINLLKERRTALISAAVTGQIDVRNHESERATA